MFGVKAAKPQSDKWGLRSSSSKMFADLKFLCTTEGKHTSCKYLIDVNIHGLGKELYENCSNYSCILIHMNRERLQFHTHVTYSKARAVPSATLTRAFQVRVLLPSSEKWSMSCKLPFPTNS